jgi:hypothetical protein
MVVAICKYYHVIALLLWNNRIEIPIFKTDSKEKHVISGGKLPLAEAEETT